MVFFLASFTYSGTKVHPCCAMCSYFSHFYGQIIFHCIHMWSSSIHLSIDGHFWIVSTFFGWRGTCEGIKHLHSWREKGITGKQKDFSPWNGPVSIWDHKIILCGHVIFMAYKTFKSELSLTLEHHMPVWQTLFRGLPLGLSQLAFVVFALWGSFSPRPHFHMQSAFESQIRCHVLQKTIPDTLSWC